MTINHRSAIWWYRTTVSPLFVASHAPPKPLKTVLFGTGPYRTLPVVSNRLPFFVKMAMRVLTVCMMWSGPTARLLSEGLRNAVVPCGPSNPTPSPSKLSTSVAPGRAPCDRCSTAAAPAGLVITGGVIGASGFCCVALKSDLAEKARRKQKRQRGQKRQKILTFCLFCPLCLFCFLLVFL